MPDVRQILIDAGWRQGVILQNGPFGHPEAIGFLVLNQTCDCVNPDFEKEPQLELLPLERLEGKPDSRLTNGQNPRQIHFQIREKDLEIWVNARITDIFQFDRAEHESLKFSSSLVIPPASLDGLTQWRAQRYLRTAFPDSFEKAFRPLSTRFGKLMAKHEGNIDFLLLSLSPFEEIGDGDCYEMQLRLMVTPKVMAQPETISALQTLAHELDGLLSTSAEFHEPACAVTALDKMNLWERRSFVDFTRYDFLSFGREEELPSSYDC